MSDGESHLTQKRDGDPVTLVTNGHTSELPAQA
jgi:hypothetical protein